MKKLSILIVLIIVAAFANAQDNYYNDEVQTIFSRNKSNGGYGAINVGYTQINGKDALISGVRGAFIFDHSFAIGLGGYGFVNNFDYNYKGVTPEEKFSLAGGYGGIFIEPIIGGRKPVHLSFPILIGMGGIALVNNYSWDWGYDYTYDDDFFFVVEPAVELEFNLARFFRLALAASYRFTSEIEMYQTDKDVLNGFNFGATFKFGKF
jgi:hypothetical protein